MKQEDFNRLKSVCEKEGFELLNLTHDDNEKYVFVKKQKDIWEGVGFTKVNSNFKGNCYLVGKIYPIKKVSEDHVWTFLDECGNENNAFNKHCAEPSTEQAYVEQLKDEAFKRFGEIKEGDRFETASGGENEFSKFGNIEWDYFKKVDQFFHYNVELYCEGKWATRVKERVKVKYSHYALPFGSDFNLSLCFLVKDPNSITKDIGNKIASKLEDYLNKEE